MSPQPDIQIRVIQPKDSERVLDFIRKNFFRDEPLTLGNSTSHDDADEAFIMSHIGHGTCLMAVQQSSPSRVGGDGDELIVGAIMAGPKDESETQHLFEQAVRAGRTKWGLIQHLLAWVERDANVYDRFGVSVALHVHASCVDASQRGRAIGARLKRELMALGRRLGYALMTADSTSFYSARLNEKLGWECVSVVRYDEYLDEQGQQIFCPPAPHECVKSFATRL